MLDITVRGLQLPDLRNGYLETVAGLRPVELTESEAEQIMRPLLRHKDWPTNYLVAEACGRVVGTVTVIIEQKLIHRGGRVAHIEDVATHPNFRQQGVGKRLLEYAIKLAGEKGCYKVILNCHPRLVPYYEQFGFFINEREMRLDLTN